MLNAVLLVLGSVLEIYSAIVVLAPLVAPLGVAYGIDPIHLGVVFLANLELGFLLPAHGAQPLPLRLALREAPALRLPAAPSRSWSSCRWACCSSPTSRPSPPGWCGW